MSSAPFFICCANRSCIPNPSLYHLAILNISDLRDSCNTRRPSKSPTLQRIGLKMTKRRRIWKPPRPFGHTRHNVCRKGHCATRRFAKGSRPAPAKTGARFPNSMLFRHHRHRRQPVRRVEEQEDGLLGSFNQVALVDARVPLEVVGDRLRRDVLDRHAVLRQRLHVGLERAQVA